MSGGFNYAFMSAAERDCYDSLARDAEEALAPLNAEIDALVQRRNEAMTFFRQRAQNCAAAARQSAQQQQQQQQQEQPSTTIIERRQPLVELPRPVSQTKGDVRLARTSLGGRTVVQRIYDARTMCGGCAVTKWQ